MTDKTKNDVTIYEEIVKDLAIVSDKTQFHVPIEKVFGAGTLANTESFGGRSLSENTASRRPSDREYKRTSKCLESKSLTMGLETP